MYLKKKTYIGNHWKTEDDQTKIRIPGIKQARIAEIVEMVATWRKANAIHKWFVDNVQDGEDNCKEYYVTKEDLQKLYLLVKEANQTKKGTALPPQAGFFFGSTERDEWYWKDMEYTEKKLEELLKEIEKDKTNKNDIIDYYYQSSW